MGLSKDFSNNKGGNFPFSLSFVVTHECNLRCVYCYENRRDKQRPNADRIKSILTEYLNKEELKEVYIDFFGGEPWLNFDLIKEICEWTWKQKWKNKYIFFTTTNGTLIHGRIKEWLYQHKNNFWCGLSLDGRKETHDKNRSNSFDKIDKDFFLECWPQQTVKMTLSKDSISTFFDDVIYIQKLGFRVAGTNFAEGIDWSDNNYVSVLCQQLEKLVTFYLEHPEFEVAPIINIPIQNCEHEPQKRKWCGTGGNMALYDIDGKKYPCQFFTPMTIPEEKYRELTDVDFTDDNSFIDNYCYSNCYFYNVCPNCYGANFLVNGKINERDKSRCALTKVRVYYAAALLANRILRKQIDPKESNTVSLQIRAIEKIRKICEEDLDLK